MIHIKTRSNLSSVRDLRADLLTAAYEYVETGAGTTLILRDCKLSPSRLDEERQRFASLMPEAARYVLILLQGEGYGSDAVMHASQQCFAQDSDDIQVRSKRPPGVGRRNVRNILMLNRVDDLGPQTVKAISKACGTSYPTTAAAIKELADQGMLYVRKDRSVELKYFPWDELRAWMANDHDPRKSARFIDRSGQPRPPSSLIKRLQQLHRPDIAISGIEGARYHYPELDLSGALRLDLVLHGSHKSDLSFVRQLDPALELSDNPYRKASLVIHFLDRPEARFETNSDQLLIADPLECLSDLYDMKLNQQMDQMIYFLSERKKRGPHA